MSHIWLERYESLFSEKLILDRSDIFGRNESENIEECSEVKLQTASTHFAQALFLQSQQIGRAHV